MSNSYFHRDLPFYPKYDVEISGHVNIWWFVKEFSQSRFNFKNIPSGSNACTIITALLCYRFNNDKIKIIPLHDYELPSNIIYAFAESILEGNEIHQKLRKSGALRNVNLTVPEAIESVKTKLRYIVEWKSTLYALDLGESLYKHFKKHLAEWYSTPMYHEHPDLYVILIADHRSVLFVFQDQEDTVTVLDSHQHLNHGAFIAQVPRMKLKALCLWFACMTHEYFNSQPDCYELSFLYFKKPKRNCRKLILQL